MESNFLQVAKLRRSIYHLGKNVSADPQDIVHLIERAVKLAPTPFNSQGVRAAILYGNAQTQAWDIIAKTTRQLAGEKKYPNFAPRIHSFKAGWGTVLFYTDRKVVQQTIKNVPAFPKHSFLEWAEQAQGISQLSVWIALAEQHLGASIHHYGEMFGPKIADRLGQHFNIPKNWHLRAEMVFGSIEKPAHPKSAIPDDQRCKVIH